MVIHGTHEYKCAPPRGATSTTDHTRNTYEAHTYLIYEGFPDTLYEHCMRFMYEAYTPDTRVSGHMSGHISGQADSVRRIDRRDRYDDTACTAGPGGPSGGVRATGVRTTGIRTPGRPSDGGSKPEGLALAQRGPCSRVHAAGARARGPVCPAPPVRRAHASEPAQPTAARLLL